MESVTHILLYLLFGINRHIVDGLPRVGAVWNAESKREVVHSNNLALQRGVHQDAQKSVNGLNDRHLTARKVQRPPRPLAHLEVMDLYHAEVDHRFGAYFEI